MTLYAGSLVSSLTLVSQAVVATVHMCEDVANLLATNALSPVCGAPEPKTRDLPFSSSPVIRDRAGNVITTRTTGPGSFGADDLLV